jgi:hypothetical protein
MPVAGRGLSLLPQGLPPAQAKALLQSCDRRRAVGRRDYAMIVLMLRLRLRAGEVAALQLEDIDWRAGQITVRGKRALCDELPLPGDVGAAIAGYLRCGRPGTSARTVFIRRVHRWWACPAAPCPQRCDGPAREPVWRLSARTGCGTRWPAICCAPAGRWSRLVKSCATSRLAPPRVTPGSMSNGCARSPGPASDRRGRRNHLPPGQGSRPGRAISTARSYLARGLLPPWSRC